jgi:hypothetical protein
MIVKISLEVIITMSVLFTGQPPIELHFFFSLLWFFFFFSIYILIKVLYYNLFEKNIYIYTRV